MTLAVFIIEALLAITAVVMLSILFIKNSAYSRDAIIIVACAATILLSGITMYRPHYDIMGQTLLIQVLMSLFLLSNVKSKNIKWVANVIKSIIIAIFVYAIAKNDPINYQVCLMTIVSLDFIYTLINFCSIKTRVLDITENLIAICIIEACRINQLSGLERPSVFLICSVAVFNMVIIFHTASRILSVKKVFKE